MWFNLMVNEKPYQDWKSRRRGAETCLVRKNGWTGAAWPSSARGLNCSLKWGNERNPHCLLQVSGKTAQLLVWEEGGRCNVSRKRTENFLLKIFLSSVAG